MSLGSADAVICGAGIAGISTAWQLAVKHGMKNVVLVDERPPMTLTSDKSTEAYRNWWPGPDDAMVRLMNRSIDLLEELAARLQQLYGSLDSLAVRADAAVGAEGDLDAGRRELGGVRERPVVGVVLFRRQALDPAQEHRDPLLGQEIPDLPGVAAAVLAELPDHPGDVGRPDDVVGIEGPEATRVEPAVSATRLAHAHHSSCRRGIERPAASFATTLTDLREILPDRTVHAHIISCL